MRGAQGGYMLSRDSAEITVKEVLETLEGPLALVECVAVGCEDVHPLRNVLHTTVMGKDK